jgi:hypothetical protein
MSSYLCYIRAAMLVRSSKIERGKSAWMINMGKREAATSRQSDNKMGWVDTWTSESASAQKAVHSKTNTVLTDKVTLERGWLAIFPQPQTLPQADTGADSLSVRSMPSITSRPGPRAFMDYC